jgi:hypothetical protein
LTYRSALCRACCCVFSSATLLMQTNVMLVTDQQGVDSCQAPCMNLHVHRGRNLVRPCRGHDTKIGHQDEVLLWHDSVNYAECTIGIITRTYLRAHGSSSCSISRRALLIQYTSCARQDTFANKWQARIHDKVGLDIRLRKP